MASSFKISMLVMMVVVVSSCTTTLTKAQDSSTSCATKLAPCQPFLATTTTPPDSCCNPIKEAVAKELPCLCKLYNDPNLFPSLGINVTQAVMLSQRCGVTTNLSSCDASAPTPTSTPPGVPGKDGGGRTAWTGLSGLLVLLAASLLY
ncbi:PREDICTED: lipid transfer-like protein VAS isoform X1 [Populus euphratica]|uniref:Lipid transfer-like protein VAS isoform X1 n=1 Tax=Populus euphratica TaxID=75702 RepID=A0AAJ6UQS5_POPEU|nr:PREDICTED: lipid transfer-like protein VAS isoform X1 [Populus euphratica]